MNNIWSPAKTDHASVGTLEPNDLIGPRDLHDKNDPQWPWETFAKQDTLSVLKAFPFFCKCLAWSGARVCTDVYIL